MPEIFTRKIKAISGDGSSSLKILPTAGKRVFALQLQITRAGGTDTLANLMTSCTEIRAKVGTNVKWRLNGTQLRDWMLLHGTTYDFNGIPSTGVQMTIPFAPEWLLENVQDALAWNPAVLQGIISVELDFTTAVACVALERVADNLDAPSTGIITMEVIKPVAGGLSFFVEKEIDPVGRLIGASIYPDSTGSQEITPVSLYLGEDDSFAHEDISSAQNDEQLERASLTPAVGGRTANIYDISPVKGDQLSRGWDLAAARNVKIKVGAAVAMAGTVSILLVRVEDR